MKNTITIIITIVWLIPLAGCVGMSMGTSPIFLDYLPNTKYIPITPDSINAINTRYVRMRKDFQALPVFESKNGYKYLIGPRDILSITVWDHPELTIPAGSFRSAEEAGHLVAEDGTIFFPYAGKVMVAGKTVQEVREILTKAISKNIVNPQLDVRVISFRSQKVYVVGEVAKPGPLPITDSPMTVVEAINLAGDLRPDADMLNVSLTREKQVINIDLTKIYGGDLSQNYLLNKNDILYIPDRAQQKVFVLGEVATPSSLIINKGKMTLSEAISDAGGVDRVTSNPTRIYVIRGTPERREIYHLDGKSPYALILGDQFKLQARDIVYVDTAGITRWNRFVEQLLPTVNVLNAGSQIHTRESLLQ